MPNVTVPGGASAPQLRGPPAPPVGDGPFPAVVVVHEIFGLTDDTRQQADRLAAAGPVALAPDLYIAGGARPLPECTGSVGILGFCMGDGFALPAATHGVDGPPRTAVCCPRTPSRCPPAPAPSCGPSRCTRRRAGCPAADDPAPVGSRPGRGGWGVDVRDGLRGRARRRARDAASAVDRAEHAAGEARDRVAEADDSVEEAVSAAVEAGLPADALLLDEQERRVAAGASEDQPFGTRGQASRRGLLKAGFSVTAGGLLAVGLAAALLGIQHQLLLLLVSLFVAIGLDPAVSFLMRRGLPRSLAVTAVVLVALALLVGFLAAIAAPLSREVTALIDAAPGYLDQLQDRSSTLGRLNGQLHLTERAQALAREGIGTDTAGSLLSVGSAVAATVFDAVIVLVLIIYFLADLPRITAAAYRLAPRHRRPRVGLLADAMIARVGGYVLGNVATSIIAFGATYVFLLVVHVPYALVLAAVVGVLDLVPLVGSTIGGAIAALVALAGVGVSAAVAVVVFTVVYRLVADYAINPVVLRRTVDVSPLVTVIAVVLGGGLLGVVGALVAVPAAAALQLLLTEVVYPQRDAEVMP